MLQYNHINFHPISNVLQLAYGLSCTCCVKKEHNNPHNRQDSCLKANLYYFCVMKKRQTK